MCVLHSPSFKCIFWICIPFFFTLHFLRCESSDGRSCTATTTTAAATAHVVSCLLRVLCPVLVPCDTHSFIHSRVSAQAIDTFSHIDGSTPPTRLMLTAASMCTTYACGSGERIDSYAGRDRAVTRQLTVDPSRQEWKGRRREEQRNERARENSVIAHSQQPSVSTHRWCESFARHARTDESSRGCEEKRREKKGGTLALQLNTTLHRHIGISYAVTVYDCSVLMIAVCVIAQNFFSLFFSLSSPSPPSIPIRLTSSRIVHSTIAHCTRTHTYPYRLFPPSPLLCPS